MSSIELDWGVSLYRFDKPDLRYIGPLEVHSFITNSERGREHIYKLSFSDLETRYKVNENNLDGINFFLMLLMFTLWLKVENKYNK